MKILDPDIKNETAETVWHGNVLCIDDSENPDAHFFKLPNGKIKKGEIYRVIEDSLGGAGYRILGFPVIWLTTGTECGWNKNRFKIVGKGY